MRNFPQLYVQWSKVEWYTYIRGWSSMKYRMDDHELDHKLDLRRLSEVSISRCAKTMPQRIFANGLVQNWRMPHFFLSGEHEVLNHGNWGVTQFSDTEAVM